jgi:hypothetical protein
VCCLELASRHLEGRKQRRRTVAVGIRPVDGEPEPAEIAKAAVVPGRTVSGVQKKLLVVAEGEAFRPVGVNGIAPYIAKFNPENLPTLVRNERLSLLWSAAVLAGSRRELPYPMRSVANLRAGPA